MNAFKQVLSAVAMFFYGFEKLASMFVNYATSGEEMSATHLDNARYERQQQQLELAAKIKALELELAAPVAPLLVANKK